MGRKIPDIFYFDSPLRLEPVGEGGAQQTTADGGGANAKGATRHVLEAIHAGSTSDYRYVDASELETFAHSFVDPYPRPVQVDHNRSVLATVGRVKASRVVDSQLKPGYKAVELEVDVVDSDAEQRIQDGRYLTVSVGFTVNEVRCSICGVNWREQDCDHWPGHSYNGKVCEMQLKGLNANEVSFVAVPADVYAGIKLEQEGKEVTEMEKLEQSDVDVNDVLQAVTPQNKNGVTQSTEATEKPAEETATTEETEAHDDIDAMALLAADVQVLSDAVGELKELADNLKDELAKLSERVGQVEGKLSKAEEETAAVFSANVTLAREVRKGLIERIVDWELVSGKISTEQQTARADELANKRTVELANLLTSLHNQIPSRPIATVESPVKQDPHLDATSPSKPTVTLEELEKAVGQLLRPKNNSLE